MPETNNISTSASKDHFDNSRENKKEECPSPSSPDSQPDSDADGPAQNHQNVNKFFLKCWLFEFGASSTHQWFVLGGGIF